ncbi:MAG: GNAT family N-acetyltransferase [Marmoricola sp.]
MTPDLPDTPIRTTLVSLELITLGDVADMLACEKDPTRRHDDWHPDYPREDDCDGVRMVREIDGWGPRQIRQVSDGLVVGSIGFFGPPEHVDGVLEAEVGYGLVEQARGQRMMSEALPALLAVTDAAEVRVRAGTTYDNAASIAVMRSAGFVVPDAPDADRDPEREVRLVREVSAR